MNTQGTKHSSSTWETVGACCCFAGGIGAAIVGSILTATTWFIGAELHPWLHGLGTGLLIETIPLLIFSGYCLDWLEHETTKPRAGEVSNANQR